MPKFQEVRGGPEIQAGVGPWAPACIRFSQTQVSAVAGLPWGQMVVLLGVGGRVGAPLCASQDI